MEEKLLLKMNNITKKFSSTVALSDVSIEFNRGEIRGLIGENGSGKSTLSNVIVGVFAPDSGSLEWKGQSYAPHSMMDSSANKICMIVQEMATINNLTVAENMFLGNEKQFSKNGIIDRKAMRAEAKKALQQIGINHIDPSVIINTVSFENRKLIEVARAIYKDPELLIVDETTTALSQNGRDTLYKVMHELCAKNKSVIFISHDLEELMEHSDSVSVMRDGVYVKTVDRKDLNTDLLKTLMIGRELGEHYYRSDYDHTYGSEVVLALEDVCFEREVRHVSFEMHKGEILGLGGLTDCGMHELGKIIFGVQKPDQGSVSLSQKGLNISSPRVAIDHKVAYISKNRDQEALHLSSSIKDNICLPSYDKIKKGILIPDSKEKSLSAEMAELLEVKMSGINQLVMNLSGGNKQKVAIAKWLGNDSEILILDCPTRGIDIGVKAAIYRLMEKLKAEGKSILMISEELPELIGMSDRILVMKDGRLSGEFLRAEALSESDIIDKMIS